MFAFCLIPVACIWFPQPLADRICFLTESDVNMVYLTQLVYLNPGKEAMFHAFEDVALALIPKHGGQLLLRVRPTAETVIAATVEIPYEVHIVCFPGEDDFKAFSQDAERQRIIHLKDESVRSSMLVKGTV